MKRNFGLAEDEKPIFNSGGELGQVKKRRAGRKCSSIKTVRGRWLYLKPRHQSSCLCVYFVAAFRAGDYQMSWACLHCGDHQPGRGCLGIIIFANLRFCWPSGLRGRTCHRRRMLLDVLMDLLAANGSPPLV